MRMFLEPLPGDGQLREAWKVPLYGSEQITFGSIFNSHPKHDKILVVFIRHFFCGNCQEYIRRISTTMPSKGLPEGQRIVIIGCGSPSLIESYREITQCPSEYDIYADPSTKLYKVLGMSRSLSLGPKAPAYIQHSLVAGMSKSIIQGLRRIPQGDVGTAGNWAVNGGEFIFERQTVDKEYAELSSTSAWKVSWCHRMQNSRDHVEVEELQEILNIGGTGESDDSCSPTEPTRTEAFNEKWVETSALRRSLSLKRQAWMRKAGQMARSGSLRKGVPQIAQTA